jgi:hypothetical protein
VSQITEHLSALRLSVKHALVAALVCGVAGGLAGAAVGGLLPATYSATVTAQTPPTNINYNERYLAGGHDRMDQLRALALLRTGRAKDVLTEAGVPSGTVNLNWHEGPKRMSVQLTITAHSAARVNQAANFLSGAAGASGSDLFSDNVQQKPILVFLSWSLATQKSPAVGALALAGALLGLCAGGLFVLARALAWASPDSLLRRGRHRQQRNSL